LVVETVLSDERKLGREETGPGHMRKKKEIIMREWRKESEKFSRGEMKIEDKNIPEG